MFQRAFSATRTVSPLLGLCIALAVVLAPGPKHAFAGASASVQAHRPWFRYLLAAIPAGGYVTLSNADSRPAVLTGASSPACGAMMLHRTEKSGGVERMVPVPRVTIPAHGSFSFAPGAYHLMCMKPRMHPGETVSVTLTFASGAHLSVPFKVFGANGAPPAAAMPKTNM